MPDWIFYLLLGASATAVAVAYFVFVFCKNRNLKNIADSQDLQTQSMLNGIAPGQAGRRTYVPVPSS